MTELGRYGGLKVKTTEKELRRKELKHMLYNHGVQLIALAMIVSPVTACIIYTSGLTEHELVGELAAIMALMPLIVIIALLFICTLMFCYERHMQKRIKRNLVYLPIDEGDIEELNVTTDIEYIQLLRELLTAKSENRFWILLYKVFANKNFFYYNILKSAHKDLFEQTIRVMERRFEKDYSILLNDNAFKLMFSRDSKEEELRENLNHICGTIYKEVMECRI